MSPEAAFAQALAGAGVARLGLAVSGGSDSMALLHLAAGWASQTGAVLEVASVDHRLRAEAGEEVALVARAACALGLSHTTLTWREAPGRGNLQDAARRARYRLLSDWARARGLEAVALGHTSDDQAETFVMRLARGSGVDGLAAMRADWRGDGLRWLRPLLGLGRQELRDWLRARTVEWVDDPSNEDLRFERVKARRALGLLGPIGIDGARLVATAQHMTRASAALRQFAWRAAREACRVEAGDVVVGAAIREYPEETRHRVFAHALGWVASARYRPRYEALVDSLDHVGAGVRRSLHGCLLTPEGGDVRISREYQAVKGEVATPGARWDRRWRLRGPDRGVTIAALGEALSQCEDWRQSGLPRASLMASPAVWRGTELVAAPLAAPQANPLANPLAGPANGWSAELDPIGGDFHHTLLLH